MEKSNIFGVKKNAVKNWSKKENLWWKKSKIVRAKKQIVWCKKW